MMINPTEAKFQVTEHAKNTLHSCMSRKACNQAMLHYAGHVQAVKLKHREGFNTDNK